MQHIHPSVGDINASCPSQTISPAFCPSNADHASLPMRPHMLQSGPRSICKEAPHLLASSRLLRSYPSPGSAYPPPCRPYPLQRGPLRQPPAGGGQPVCPVAVGGGGRCWAGVVRRVRSRGAGLLQVGGLQKAGSGTGRRGGGRYCQPWGAEGGTPADAGVVPGDRPSGTGTG